MSMDEHHTVVSCPTFNVTKKLNIFHQSSSTIWFFNKSFKSPPHLRISAAMPCRARGKATAKPKGVPCRRRSRPPGCVVRAAAAVRIQAFYRGRLGRQLATRRRQRMEQEKLEEEQQKRMEQKKQQVGIGGTEDGWEVRLWTSLNCFESIW